ncbi:alanine--tRNA ligase [Mycoplasmopsis primatum]|uniref:alanine--tRNA ligase n=1 Tax=Mycoplasmopsis primatum TaxID=55604 RepID=UPI00049773BF|nr:alanine--tRNA ligase [Mycoplasmopsis primatum]
MEKLLSSDIRRKWLDFFKSKGHTEIESKSLIPVNDLSLLWINSGVATLKDFFSGKKIPPSKRLTNSQKAIRTNDIENVGVTSRHHTFFEMLGNFSIGDYFKKEAIDFAKEFLIDVLKMDIEKLYITYYEDDIETKNFWINKGIKESHLIKGNRETNFWDLGSGPCGPCTEIYYDRGEKYDKRGIQLLQDDIENDRYIEIWNIVFSQFNNDGEGNYTELKQKNIDTGAGLERLASIMQDVPTNYDSDLFMNIIHEIEKYSPYKYKMDNYFIKDKEQTEINTNFKIIADHIRTATNAIADGAKISNVGRGYIIRRLIRRACYKAMQLKINGLFLYKLVKVVKDNLPYDYDEKDVAKQIKEEEKLFNKTVENGKLLLESQLKTNSKVFDGSIAFNLLETYGFPIELTEEILAQKNIKIDMQSFNEAKEKHILVSKGNKASGMEKVINSLALIKRKMDTFVGYEHLSYQSKIRKIFDEEKEVKTLNGKGYIVLNYTPFYATGGGQRHDKGYMTQDDNRIEILDVFKDKFGNHIHVVKGKIDISKPINCFVDTGVRMGLARNHTGTHLLFCALRKVLGPHIEQLGSDITEDRLTFDFPSDEKPTDKQIKEIENLMHEYIQSHTKGEFMHTTIEKAKELGAIMTLDEEEYMDPKCVRVVRFGNITSDLCGGTHLDNTSMLEDFKITHVERKQAGVYRIRAVSSYKLVNDFLIENNKKNWEELKIAINKVKEINPQYEFKYNGKKFDSLEQESKYVIEAINQVRNDFKNELKNSSIVEFDYNTVKFEKIGKYNVYINLNVKPSQVKIITATIRDKFTEPNNIVLIGAKNDKQLLIGIASRAIDSNILFKAIANKLNGKGGGSSILVMGKVDYDENIESIIKEALINA